MFGKKELKLAEYQPTDRGFYAFNVERAGDFLIYIESSENSHRFLYVPGANPFYMTFEDFTNSVKKGVLSFVEQLPEDVFKESLELSCPSA